MGFDLDGARQAGYSDQEIADHLGSKAGFDTASARQAGYSDGEIIQNVMGRWGPTTTEVDVAASRVGVPPGQAGVGPVNQLQPLPPDPVAQELERELALVESTLGRDSAEYQQLANAKAGLDSASTQEVGLLTHLSDVLRATGEGVVGQGAGTTLSGAGELYDVAARQTDRLVSAVLPESVVQAARDVPVPGALQPGQILKRPGAELKDLGEQIGPPKERRGLHTDIAAGVGQLGFQIAAYLGTGGLSSSAMLLSQGADVMAEKTRGDVAPQANKDTAIVAGAGITALTERVGLNLILDRVPPAIKNNVLRYLADVAVAGGIEASQEVAEGILHDLSRRFLTNENAPIGEGVTREAIAAGGAGAIARAVLAAAGIRGARSPAAVKTEQEQEPAPKPTDQPTQPPPAEPPGPPPAAGATPVLKEAPAEPAEAVATQIEQPATVKGFEGAPRRIWTAKGEPIDTRLEVIDADQLVASHDAVGNVNPAFPAELQPRDRSRQASRAQISGIAQNLKPELLGDTGTASDGAPVIGPDNVVESGNARTLGIRQAYETGRGEEYKKWLTDNAGAFGIDPGQIAGMGRPILVRRRSGKFDADQRAAFARDANQATIAAMSPAEIAKADAERITNQDMAHFAPDESGNVLAASNEVFLRQFAKRLGTNETAGFMTADGRPTKQLADRVQQAVFAKAYQDPRLVALQAEEASPDIRNILAGLTQAAPAFARARSVDPKLGNLDAVSKLVEAADVVRKAKANDQGVAGYLAQQGLFEQVSPETAALARFMDDNKRSPKRMGEAFRTLGDTIEKTLRGRQNGQLFGDDQITLPQVIEAAGARMSKEYGATQAQADLLAPTEAAQNVPHGTIEPGTPPPKNRPIVLVYGGSFSPVHKGHVQAIQDAKAWAEKQGYTVSKVYVAPSADRLLKDKLGDQSMPVSERAALARTAFKGTGFEVTTGPAEEAEAFTGKLKRTQLADWAQSRHPGETVVNVTGEDQAPGSPPGFPSVYSGDSGTSHEGRYYLAMPRGADSISSTTIRNEAYDQRPIPAEQMDPDTAKQFRAWYEEMIQDADQFGLPRPLHVLADNDPLLTPTDKINTPERQALREKIVEDTLDGGVAADLDDMPVVYFMGGGGASGKTTIRKNLSGLGLFDDNIPVINSDDIKEAIPEYNEILKAGDWRAANVVHEESSELSKRASKLARDRRISHVMDITLGSPDKGIKLMREYKDAGYRVVLLGLTVDEETAVRRAVSRARDTGRYVPTSEVIKAHKGFSNGFRRYARIADQMFLYDTNSEVARITASGFGGSIDVLLTDAYNSFLRKGASDEKARTFRQLRQSREGPPGGRETGQGIAESGVSESTRENGEQSGRGQGETAESGNVPAERNLNIGGTLYANPFGIAASRTIGAYRRIAQSLIDRFHDKVGHKYFALKDLPKQDKFLTRYYELLGKVTQIEGVQHRLYEAFKGASDTDKVAVYNYLTTKNADPASIVDPDTRRAAVAAKRLIDRSGERLVHEGLLSRATADKYRGEYLPRVYLKHLLGESGFKAFGRGLVPGDMGYLKERQDIPEDVRRLILGEIKDPGYLASRGYGLPARDVAILDFYTDIAAEKSWIYPNVVTEWAGRPVSVFWLEAEAKRLQEQIPYLPQQDRTQAEQIVKKMRSIYEPIIDELGKQPSDYRQVPNAPRYGAMRGLWVRKEIFELMLGNRNITVDNDAMQKIINGATIYNGIWKSAKVAWNPPAQVRNHVSNGILVHLSGVPFALVPIRYIQAIQAIRSNNKYWRTAKRYGVTASGFTNQELIRIERDLVDLLAREKGKVSMATLKNMAGIVNNAVGDAYQFSESLWKTAKIIDAMKREGKSPADAAKAAHDAVFDYSLVPATIKKLRTMPVGSPFITFYYKVLPNLLKTAIVHPERFVPYVAIPYILAEFIKETFDVTDDDLKALQKALPMWLQEKGTAYFLPIKDAYGRWQAMDFGYFFPWGNLQTTYNAITSTATRGAVGRTADVLQSVGAFGGPVPNLITFVQSGRDPFTKREVISKDDPPEKQLADTMEYLWRLNAPTWVTDIGVAGHMYRSLTGKVNPRLGPQFGEQMSTPGQAALRGVGINVYPIDPEATREENLRSLAFDVKNVARRLKLKIRDPNLSEEQKAGLIEQYNALIEQRRGVYEKYEKESELGQNVLRGNQ